MPSRFVEDRRGVVAIMAGLVFSLAVGAAAFGIDVGRLFLDRRKAQATADLAALSAASNLSDDPRAYADATIAANGLVPTAPTSVAFGIYTPDPRMSPSGRFQVQTSPTGANAVRVGVRTDAPAVFGRILTGQSRYPITATATATTTAFASFAIGSRLAAIDGGTLNAVLGALIGGSVSLTAVDYQSLADARVDLFDVTSALATRARLTGPSYGSVLSADVGIADILSAVATAGRNGSTSSAAANAAMSALAAAAGSATAQLGSVIGLGPYANMPLGQRPASTASASMLDLLGSTAQIANGSRQVSVTSGLSVPGLANIQLDVAVGERPVASSPFATGTTGATVGTAQTRIRLRTQLALGGGTAMDLPIYLEVARASATLDRLSCVSGAMGPSVTLGVTPGILSAQIGEVSPPAFGDFTRPAVPDPAPIVSLGPLRITARARAAMGNTDPQPVSFSLADTVTPTRKIVSTTNYTSPLTASLLADLQLTATAGGLTVPVPPLLRTQIAAAVATAAPRIDDLLASTLGLLGAGLGQADVWVAKIRCDGSVLVN